MNTKCTHTSLPGPRSFMWALGLLFWVLNGKDTALTERILRDIENALTVQIEANAEVISRLEVVTCIGVYILHG